MLHVFGHKNPDTDAILSAMLYAKYIQLTGFDAKPYRLGTLNNETIYALQMLGWESPELITSLPAGSSVVLTDHNEKSQTIEGIENLKIEAIIDHHKCTIVTSEPTEIIIKPIASTCSVIYRLWKAANLPISQEIARAMMMGIISDTLFFRSPTTTQYDQFIFNQLQEIAQFDNPEEISLAMFAAKSDLGQIAVRDLVTMDYKVFEVQGKKFGAGTIETTNPAYALGRKSEIVVDLLALKKEQGLDMIMLSVVDILQEKNMTIVPSQEDAHIIKAVFGAETHDNVADLGSRISRKKQIAPQLTDYFAA